MAVCYFNNDYEKNFNCEYEITENGFEVVVDYDINEELLAKTGVRIIYNDTKFDERDILIVDSKNKKNYLLKNASYRGHTETWGTPDSRTKTNFYAYWYFMNSDYKQLCNLKITPKVKKIRIYSNLINDNIGCPSLSIEEKDKLHVINLKKNNEFNSIYIGDHNIKSITIGDYWYIKHNNKLYNINIQLDGFIELELFKRINYEDVYDYIYELIIFIQLFIPEKFKISKISVLIDDIQLDLHVPLRVKNYKDTYVAKTVDEDILIFLKNCYKSIPYRNSKTEIRNIPYIVLNTYRGLEDNFLMFYRFIECYYKKQNKKDITTNFIKYSIEHNYKNKSKFNEDEIENISQEIVCLRNHYAHSGYYIKNKSLKIVFRYFDKKIPNPKNYTANNVDIDWIYKRTKILYEIVLDVIFSNMLGYERYKFHKHF